MFPISFASRSFLRHCSCNVSNTRFHFRTGQSWKSFTSSTGKLASKRDPRSKPGQSSLKFAGRRPEGFGILERKVATKGDILLFKAPSHRVYLLSAYTLAGACFAASMHLSYTTFRDPLVPLATWMKFAVGAGSVALSFIGARVIMKTFHLVKTIKAVRSNGTVCIRFSVRKPFPFMKPLEFDVSPRQIAFSRRLVAVVPSPGATPKKEQPATYKSLLSAPSKKISLFFWRFYRAMRQVFTDEDYLMVDVEGEGNAFKLDIQGLVSEDFLRVSRPMDIKRS